MPINISALNGVTVNQFDSSVQLTIGTGVTTDGAGNYTMVPNGFGNLSSFDNWTGVLGAPDPGDILSYHLTVADLANGVIQYQFTTGDGSVNPSLGGIGAEILAYNNNGVLAETINGYQPGNSLASITANLTGNFISFGNADLSQFEAGFTGPASVAFGQTGASAFLGIAAVPEPSTVLLMPLLVAAVLVARIPVVRSFLRARHSFVAAG
jgi:hypothetical protein